MVQRKTAKTRFRRAVRQIGQWCRRHRHLAVAEQWQALSRKLRSLHDAPALWYARAERVAALSALHGEAKAVTMVQSLTPVFKGLVPKSLMDASSRQRH